ncbi:MAG: FIST C-terminal domain-containing protein [Verrucomicrobiae bacterium]|nr:FIST C-terminal domain-containing protein [Verrucomicrobiae bacterium]
MLSAQDIDNRAASVILRTTFNEGKVSAAIRDCRERLGGAPSLVFAFVSADWEPHLKEFLEIVQVEGHAARIVGCSGYGLMGVGQEDENVSGISLLFLRLPNTDIRLIEIDDSDLSDAEAGLPWPSITGVAPDDFGGWIALANPARMRSEIWLRQWNTVYPGEAVFGGLCSGGPAPEDLFLFTEKGLAKEALLLVRLSGGIRLGGVVSQGCRPIGEPYTITEVDDNVVVTIGQRRAYEVLEEAYESLEEEEQAGARGNIFAGLAMTEYKDELRRGDFLVRNILGGDPTAGVLALGAYPRVGQTLQFQLRDKDTADEDLLVQCAGAQTRYGEPFGALLFSCAGRGARMFEAPNHDAGIIEEVFGRVPISGFFCNGEIGPVGGQNFIHGYTAAAAFFLNP